MRQRRPEWDKWKIWEYAKVIVVVTYTHTSYHLLYICTMRKIHNQEVVWIGRTLFCLLPPFCRVMECILEVRQPRSRVNLRTSVQETFYLWFCNVRIQIIFVLHILHDDWNDAYGFLTMRRVTGAWHTWNWFLVGFKQVSSNLAFKSSLLFGGPQLTWILQLGFLSLPSFASKVARQDTLGKILARASLCLWHTKDSNVDIITWS